MNTKGKGTRNEHRSMALLEAAGSCTRAAASLGIFDIVGIGPTDVVLVQCKTRDWPGSVEMETISNFQCPPGCRKSSIAGATEHGSLMSAPFDFPSQLGISFSPCSRPSDFAAAPYIES